MSAVASLWPEINVDIVPPATVLRVQAAALGRLTKGILDAEVTTVKGDDSLVIHRLDLIAPVLEDRRERILTVTHRDRFYPLLLEAECFREPDDWLRVPKPMPAATLERSRWPDPKNGQVAVADYDEFLNRLGDTLRSGPVRAVIDSLIALSNERSAGEEATPTDPAA